MIEKAPPEKKPIDLEPSYLSADKTNAAVTRPMAQAPNRGQIAAIMISRSSCGGRGAVAAR
jgi:hypothetical protein